MLLNREMIFAFVSMRERKRDRRGGQRCELYLGDPATRRPGDPATYLNASRIARMSSGMEASNVRPSIVSFQACRACRVIDATAR